MTDWQPEFPDAKGRTPVRKRAYPSTPLSLIEPSENPQIPQPIDDREIRAVIETLHETTGRHVTTAHAALVVKQILNGRVVRNGAAYLTKAIRNESNPQRLLPTPSPPPYSSDEFVARRSRGPGSNEP